MDEFLGELDEDVEGMQSTIYLLQQQLKELKEQLAQAIQDNHALRMASNTHIRDTGPVPPQHIDSSHTAPPTHTDSQRPLHARTEQPVSNHASFSPQTPVTTNGGHKVETDMEHSGHLLPHTQTNHRHETQTTNREHSGKNNRSHGRTDTQQSADAPQDWSPQHSRHLGGVKVKMEVDDNSFLSEPERTSNKMGPWANETLQNGIEDTSQSDSVLETISERSVEKMEA